METGKQDKHYQHDCSICLTVFSSSFSPGGPPNSLILLHFERCSVFALLLFFFFLLFFLFLLFPLISSFSSFSSYFFFP